MSLRNLIVYDNNNLVNAQTIRNRIAETEGQIEKSFLDCKEEAVYEYNFGTLIQPYELSLIIYNNPDRQNNPYVFFYVNTDENKALLQRVDEMFFIGFADDLRFSDFISALKMGFRNASKLSFLSEGEIKKARAFSEEYDRQLGIEKKNTKDPNIDP